MGPALTSSSACCSTHIWLAARVWVLLVCLASTLLSPETRAAVCTLGGPLPWALPSGPRTQQALPGVPLLPPNLDSLGPLLVALNRPAAKQAPQRIERAGHGEVNSQSQSCPWGALGARRGVSPPAASAESTLYTADPSPTP